MTIDLETLLRERRDREVATAPPAPALSDVIATCERDLTRHRRSAAKVSAVALAAGVVVVVGSQAFLDGSATRSDQVAANPLLVDAGVDLNGHNPAVLIESCRAGAQSAEDTDLLFSTGTPRIVAYSHTLEATSTVLMSPDDTVWADCLNADKRQAGTNTVMSVYTAEPSSSAPFSAGYSCPERPTIDACGRFVVDLVDRLPSEVAQVDFKTIDGETTTVEADEYGLVLFDYEGTAPETSSGDEDDPNSRTFWVTQITYRDAVGSVLASNRFEQSSGSPSIKEVPGVPELSAYPSRSLRPDGANIPWVRQPSTAGEANALPCDPGRGKPQVADGCEWGEPQTGWLTGYGGGHIRIAPFTTYTNDAAGEAFAQANDLDYPFPGDVYDAPVGRARTFDIDADVVCSGIIRIDYESSLADHVVDCSEMKDSAAAGDRVAVALWIDGSHVKQISEMYRP